MSLFYIFAGAQHFANTDWYMKIMPPYLPYHKELIYLSGVIEIIGPCCFLKKQDFWQVGD